MDEAASITYKITIVVGYCMSSIGIMFVNKIILTANQYISLLYNLAVSSFPSTVFLGASQMFMTATVLIMFSLFNIISIPRPSRNLLSAVRLH